MYALHIEQTFCWLFRVTILVQECYADKSENRFFSSVALNTSCGASIAMMYSDDVELCFAYYTLDTCQSLLNTKSILMIVHL